MAQRLNTQTQKLVMSWPTPQDYNEAVQNPSLSFLDSDLKTGQPALTSLGLPRPITGNFASVYRIKGIGADWAVRCFLRNIPDQADRYVKISQQLDTAHLPYTVDFHYLDQGIKTHGQWYPILKMQWVEGVTLGNFIDRNVDNSALMGVLAEHFKKMISALRADGIAHGDLQHGNILVLDNDFKLVDYDGMFVPDLYGLKANELGHRNYQHPGRTETFFGPNLDNFSSWVIYTSLVCLSIDPTLWLKLHGGDECLLFRQQDFKYPLSSHTFAVLEAHPSDVIKRGAKFLRSFVLGSVEAVPSLDEIPAEPMNLPPIQEGTALPSWLASAPHLSDTQTASHSSFTEYASKHAAHTKQGWQGASTSRQQAAARSQASQGSSQQTGYHPVSPAVYNYASGPIIRPSYIDFRTVGSMLSLAFVVVVYLLGIGISVIFPHHANFNFNASTAVQEQKQMSGQDYYDQASTYYNQKNYAAAATLYQSAMTAYSDQYFGIVNGDYALSRYMLGCCNFYMKKYSDAISDLANALAIYQQAEGIDDQRIAEVMNCLGSAYLAKGDLPNAIEQYDNALKIYTAIFPTNDTHLAIVESNLGLAYNRQKNFSEAAPHLTRALSIYKDNNNSAGMLNVLKELGYNYQHTKNSASLQETKAQIKALTKKMHGLAPVSD